MRPRHQTPGAEMVAVSKRPNIWFAGFFILMLVGGFCVIGYWQTYDIKCGGARAVWVWTKAPPQFECHQF